MKRLVLLATALLCIVYAPAAQTPAEFREKIQTAVETREYIAAANALQKFRNQDRKVFDANNYDYLLGRMAEKTGDFALAMSGYQSVVARGSILSPYARWHLSQVARSTGNLALERISLLEIITAFPDTLLSPAVRNRLARSFFESKNYAETIRLLTTSYAVKTTTATASQKTPDNVLAREDLLLLADAYLRANKLGEARDAYSKLLSEISNPAQPDDFALAAAKALDLLDGGVENRSVAKLADAEHLRRANIYQFNRDYGDARLHYRAIIENYPESGLVPDAIYQIGRGYAQLGECIEAIQWFERVSEQFPEHPVAKDALTQAASCYSKTAKYKEAIQRYRKFIERYPNDERLDRAYLNIVDVLRDEGEEQESLKWAINTEQVFRGKPPEAIAVFTEARIYLAGSDWVNALKTLDRLKVFPDLGGTKVPGGTNIAEVEFLRAFCLEQLARYDEAIDVYLSIPDGRGEYYGGRASERLLLLAGSDRAKGSVTKKVASLDIEARSKDAETSRKSLQSLIRLTTLKEEREKLLEALRGVYGTLPAYQKIPSFKLPEIGRRELLKDNAAKPSENVHRVLADELFFLGLYDEAGPEFEANLSSPDAAKTGDTGYALAIIYNRGDTANRAVGFVEPLWRNVPADYQVELIPRDQLDLLYPAPYADALLKYAPTRDVDPRFVLSIIRQESRYRAQVKSYAAARGLMQFISTTADKIAGEVGRDNFRQDDLYDPQIAILFGSQYLADLFKQFPAMPAAVSASYNGGADNMQRWLNRSKSNVADRYVPEIIFSQSKDYVYKVLANYRIYQMIRDENLKLR